MSLQQWDTEDKAKVEAALERAVNYSSCCD
jgi:hypothetical protein